MCAVTLESLQEHLLFLDSMINYFVIKRDLLAQFDVIVLRHSYLVTGNNQTTFFEKFSYKRDQLPYYMFSKVERFGKKEVETFSRLD